MLGLEEPDDSDDEGFVYGGQPMTYIRANNNGVAKTLSPPWQDNLDSHKAMLVDVTFDDGGRTWTGAPANCLTTGAQRLKTESV